MKIEESIDCSHTVRCLKAAGIEEMEQLVTMDKATLLQIRGIGEKIATYLCETIAKYHEE